MIMKKTFKINFLLPLTILLAVTGCKKSFEDLTQNNNKPSSVPASLLFNGVCISCDRSELALSSHARD